MAGFHFGFQVGLDHGDLAEISFQVGWIDFLMGLIGFLMGLNGILVPFLLGFL